MFLYQIEERLKRLRRDNASDMLEKAREAYQKTRDPKSGRNMGVRLDYELAADVDRIKDALGLDSRRETVYVLLRLAVEAVPKVA